MKIFFHAKTDNFEGQYFSISVTEEFLRRRNPQLYLVRMERITPESFLMQKNQSSLNQVDEAGQYQNQYQYQNQNQYENHNHNQNQEQWAKPLQLESSRITNRSARLNRKFQHNPYFAFVFDCENYSYEGHFLIAPNPDSSQVGLNCSTKVNLDISMLCNIDIPNFSNRESLITEHQVRFTQQNDEEELKNQERVGVDWGEGIRVLRLLNNQFVDLEDFRNDDDSEEEEERAA